MLKQRTKCFREQSAITHQHRTGKVSMRNGYRTSQGKVNGNLTRFVFTMIGASERRVTCCPTFPA